jgi:DNA helicase-2/ATP-dependent DNA helicase PcrA
VIYKYYGPPGTGKTHRLISRAKAYVRVGTPLHKIGYFAFTRKAAKEARERMPIDDKKLEHFQTLHSFAYNTLGLQEENIMQPFHYEDLGKQLGIRVKYSDKYNEEESHFLTCNDPYFQLIGRAINRDVNIREEFDRNEHDRKQIKWSTLKHIHDNLMEYKKQAKLQDFNDIINNVLEKVPQFDVIFIDEAQDLSPLQWKLYDKLKENSKDVYLAGDDDQAIFAWAGADVERFIKEPAKEKVLNKSKRISRSVQEESNKPVERISGIRKQKEYLPRDYEGECKYISNLGQVDLTKGKWLILTRTKNQLLELMKELRKKNLYYQSNRGRSYKVRLYKAAKLYTDWTKGKILDEKEEKECKDFMGDEHFNRKSNWYDVFVAAPEKEIRYIRLMLENGENLDEDARIFMSTIHAIKGGEQDNVILSLHQGDKIQKSIKRSVDKRDEEHRVWYVGITRARNNLYKLKAKIKRKEYKL